jgi:flagellum-specific peptidoglycan hydrolase FlgJ
MKETFIALMWKAIRNVDLKGSHPSVAIAQAAVESAWGGSVLSQDYNNYFGIKAGSSWKGKIVNMATGEVYNGQNVIVTSGFRVYDSLEDSLKDRIQLLVDHYPEALRASTPELEIQALKNGGYATSPNYVQTVVSVIDSNNLRQYDNIKYMKITTTYSIFLALGIAIAALSAYHLFMK